MKLVLSMLLLTVNCLEAGIIYDNGLPSRGQAFGGSLVITAEPFQFSAGATIAAVRVWDEGPQGKVSQP